MFFKSVVLLDFGDVILTGNGCAFSGAAGLVGHVWSFDCATSRYPCSPSPGLYLTADMGYWQTGSMLFSFCRLCTMKLYNMGQFEAAISPMIIVYSWKRRVTFYFRGI